MWAGCYPLFIHIFAAYEPNHRCLIPSCDSLNSQFNESHAELSIPKEESGGHMFTEAEYFDPCKRFDFVQENIDDNMVCSEELFSRV
jgi:hypothetical protein